MTDVVTIKMFGKGQTLLLEPTRNLRDAQGLLLTLNGYRQGYVPDVWITKVIDPSDWRVSSHQLKVATMLGTETINCLMFQKHEIQRSPLNF